MGKEPDSGDAMEGRKARYWALFALVFVVGLLPVAYAAISAQSRDPTAVTRTVIEFQPVLPDTKQNRLLVSAMEDPDPATSETDPSRPKPNDLAPVVPPQRSTVPMTPSTQPALEGPVTLVRVIKSARRLVLLSDDSVIRTYPIALGGNPIGHKQQQGDMRSPEGRYILDWRNAKSQYFRSIHVSYPNKADKVSARKLGVDPGGDIMIHGQPNGWTQWFVGIQSDWTFGCIAVTNEHMSEIWAMVKDGTPIEISP